MKRLLISALALALAACGGEAADTTADMQAPVQALAAPAAAVEAVAPAAPSLSTERLALIEKRLQEEVDQGVRSGFVAMVGTSEGAVYETAVGLADIEAGKPMTLQTQFRIASMTKPVTSVGIMMLVDRGELLLSDPVSRYIPPFGAIEVASSYEHGASGEVPAGGIKEPITIFHLLTHTGGLGYIFDYETDLGREMIDKSLYTLEGDLGTRIEALAAFPLYNQPGSEWRYSYATDVLGRVIEVVSGQPLEVFVQQEILGPLKMNDTGFYLDNPDFSKTAVVYRYDEAGTPIRAGKAGLNPDPNADAPGWASGGGGLVSTAGDYMRFMRMLMNGGELDGVRLLSPATVKLMASPHIIGEKLKGSFMEGNGAGFGLGFSVVTNPGEAETTTSEGQYGWGGYYDTVFWISPDYDLGVVLMAQREPGPNVPESRAREIVDSIAYGALE